MSTTLPATTAPATPFDREAQAVFCEHLATHGNVRLAARSAGVHHTTAYRMRRSCARFGELWQAALVLARLHAEEVLADRALNGVEEKVFYHGEEVAVRVRYDSRLLLAHLGRLDRLSHDPGVHEAARFFDYRLEDLREDVLDHAFEEEEIQP